MKFSKWIFCELKLKLNFLKLNFFQSEIELLKMKLNFFKIELLCPRAKTKMTVGYAHYLPTKLARKKIGAAQGKILYKCGPGSMKFGPISIWRVLVDLRLFNGPNLCSWWRKKKKNVDGRYMGIIPPIPLEYWFLSWIPI